VVVTAKKPKTEVDTQFDAVRESMRKANVGGNVNAAAVDRLLSDYETVYKSTHHGWDATPVAGNIFVWTIRFFNFDPKSLIFADFQELKKKGGPDHVELAMKFPKEYPHKPPFIRVVKPRFTFHTGHVTVGGSICMELLTDEGWRPVFSIESTLESIYATVTDGGRIDLSNPKGEYQEQEAIEAFNRVAEHHRKHGW
jgi:ubiquitin-conjugating enzyme E2 Q